MDAQREATALFWYSLLIPLLQKGLGRAEKRKLIEDLAAREWEIPYSKKRRVSAETIRRKLRAYETEGFPALAPAVRSDKGTSRAIPQEVLDKAMELKRELPKRSVRALIEILNEDPDLPTVVLTVSTLSRLLKERGHTTPLLSDDGVGVVFRKFQRKHINSLWQSDAKHGPYLPSPWNAGVKTQTMLFACLDDCSRLVTYAEFYWDGRLPRLEDCLRKGIESRGVPEDFYADNGNVYNSKQLALICGELKIRLIHSTPYRPEGRGKIERFFGTVETDFLPEARVLIETKKIDTLEDLNRYFQAWLEMSYQRRLHPEVHKTPLEVWEEEKERVRFESPPRLREVFLWREERTVSKYGVVSIQGNQYEVAGELAKTRVEVRFNPFDLAEVSIFVKGTFVQRARPISLDTEVHRDAPRERRKPPEKAPKPLSASYLHILLERYEKTLEERRGELAMVPLEERHASSREEDWNTLHQKTAAKFGRALRDLERNALRGILEQFGPRIISFVPHVELQGNPESPICFCKFVESLKRLHLSDAADSKE